jgi:hypothetical protein
VLGEAPTQLQVYAALIDMNGGSTQVSGWGVEAFGVGRYGVHGLSQSQALLLLSLSSFVSGVMAARGDSAADSRWLAAAVEAEWQRVDAIRAEKRAAC